MADKGRAVGLGAAVLGAVAALAAIFAPREAVTRSGPFEGDLSDPDAFLAAREERFDDITPGAEARIVWAGERGARTPLSVVYFHGFSATSEEIRPVPDRLAEALGANLVFARLTGHGRDGAALAEATAGDWMDDATAILAVARAVGEEVMIVATSTGATLASIAMDEPDMAEGVAGLAMISPNFRLASPAGRLLTWPLARLWVPLVAGRERAFEVRNEVHGTFWTTRYPTVALLPMAALMAEARARDHSKRDIPLLVLYSPEDQVISARAAEEFARGWGGPVRLNPVELPEEGADVYAHVIAGDALSPAMTDEVSEILIDWVASIRPHG